MPLEMIDTSYIKRSFLDVKYATNSETQKLDIYLPEQGDGPFPVILSVHGGAFKKGDKRDSQLTGILEGLNRGYAVVSINYRLSGEAIFPANIYDVKAAVRFIKANAEKFSLDKNKIAAWGGSAGGNLCALLGTSFNHKELEDLTMGNSEESCEVQAIVDWFGPINFLKMDEQLAESGFGPCDHSDKNSPESLVLGDKITEIPEIVKRANPITYVNENVPPFLIQHGSKDNIVPHQQSILLKDALLKVADESKVQFEIIEGARHGSPEFTSEENLHKVFKFLDINLKLN